MKVVVALGGNALLRRGQLMTIENQLENVATACEHLAPVARAHDLVITHGNGPQVGLLALESAAYTEVPAYPLDVLGAESEGMVGYLVERELRNRLPHDRLVATVLTMTEVDLDDPAFAQPTKPIGPLYDADEASELERERGWEFRPDGDRHRRVVPSPKPLRIVEDRVIEELLGTGCVVLCSGGGGIPTARDVNGRLVGVEAVIDKDAASSLLARELVADVFVMATDVSTVCLDFGTPRQRAVTAANPHALLDEHRDEFAPGSMGPKVAAAFEFAASTGNPAVIGQLADIEELVSGTAGTRISEDTTGVHTTPADHEES